MCLPFQHGFGTCLDPTDRLSIYSDAILLSLQNLAKLSIQINLKVKFLGAKISINPWNESFTNVAVF